MSGGLPEGWTAAPLKAGLVTDIQTGFACGKHSRDATGVPHMRPMNVSEAGRIALDNVKYVLAAEVDCEERWLRSGDVVFNNTNSPELVGKTAFYDCPDARAFSNHMTRVRCVKSVLDAQYCAMLLHHRWSEGYFADICNNHVSQASVGRSVLLDTEVPLPPLPEQRRIVERVGALFERVSRAKEQLDRVAAMLKRLRQAVLASACSGKLTEDWRSNNPGACAPPFRATQTQGRNGRRGANSSREEQLLVDEMPELPRSWRYMRLDAVALSGTVVTYGIVLPGPEAMNGVPYVRQQDIEDGGVRVADLRHTTREIAAKHERSSLRAGDILLCIIRNLRVAIVPEGLDGANITQGAVRIRPAPDLVRREYLAAYLGCVFAQTWMQSRYFGMAMPRINVEDARAIPIAVPPLSEQDEIVRQMGGCAKLLDRIEERVAASAARAAQLPQAILSKAFSGELVPTEAELARAEGRSYETAEELLARVRASLDLGRKSDESAPRRHAGTKTRPAARRTIRT